MAVDNCSSKKVKEKTSSVVMETYSNKEMVDENV